MKTALNQLIEKWEIERGSYIPNAPIYDAFIDEAKTFLQKEKEQIIEAYNEGYRERDLDILNQVELSKDISDFDEANDYYKKTYK